MFSVTGARHTGPGAGKCRCVVVVGWIRRYRFRDRAREACRTGRAWDGKPRGPAADQFCTGPDASPKRDIGNGEYRSGSLGRKHGQFPAVGHQATLPAGERGGPAKGILMVMFGSRTCWRGTSCRWRERKKEARRRGVVIRSPMGGTGRPFTAPEGLVGGMDWGARPNAFSPSVGPPEKKGTKIAAWRLITTWTPEHNVSGKH